MIVTGKVALNVFVTESAWLAGENAASAEKTKVKTRPQRRFMRVPQPCLKFVPPGNVRKAFVAVHSLGFTPAIASGIFVFFVGTQPRLQGELLGVLTSVHYTFAKLSGNLTIEGVRPLWRAVGKQDI